MLENNNNWVKAYIVDVLPCISIAFFVLAFVYNSSYYSEFGIDIIQYATFGDIFISITEPLIIYALVAAVIFCLFVELYTVILDKNIKEKNRKYLFPKFAYRYLRCLVKIKDRLGYLANMGKPKKKSITKKRHDFLLLIILSMTFYCACGMIFMRLIELNYIKPTASACSLSLVIPLLMVYFFESSMVYNQPGKVLYFKKHFRESTLKMLVFGACYYVYAIMMFAGTGLEKAKQAKSDNTTKFEISTSSDAVFTNKDYIYIGHVSGETFIQKRDNKEIVILGNDGIVYTKIQNNYTNILGKIKIGKTSR